MNNFENFIKAIKFFPEKCICKIYIYKIFPKLSGSSLILISLLETLALSKDITQHKNAFSSVIQ